MAKSAKGNVVFLFGKDAELPDTKLDVGHLFAAEDEPNSRETGIDLTGKPKVIFLIGSGATGKTTFARWLGERSEQRDSDPPPVLVSVDPLKRDLALYHPRTIQPNGTNPAIVVGYLEKLFSGLLDEKRSAVIDFGGGDTALMALLKQTLGLHTMLEDGGLEPVAMHFLSPRVNDLTPLVALERAGFQPRATALILNTGRTDPSKPTEEWFSHVRRQPGYRAAIERGAVEVWFPNLFAAKAIEDRTIGFWAAINHASMPPLSMFDHRRVSDWLGKMDKYMAPITSWIDL